MITVTMVENLNEKYIVSVTGLDSSSRSYWPQSHSVPPPPPMVKRASLKMLKDFNWKFHKNAMLNTLPTFLHFIFLTQ